MKIKSTKMIPLYIGLESREEVNLFLKILRKGSESAETYTFGTEMNKRIFNLLNSGGD